MAGSKVPRVKALFYTLRTRGRNLILRSMLVKETICKVVSRKKKKRLAIFLNDANLIQQHEY